MAPLSTLLHPAGASAPLAKRYYYYTYSLGTAAIVGIVIPCIIIFLLLVLLCVRHSRRKSAVPYQQQPAFAYRTADGRPIPPPNAVPIYNTASGNPAYPNQYPSQYGQPQPQMANYPKDAPGQAPIADVPPTYAGPGTFYHQQRQPTQPAMTGTGPISGQPQSDTGIVR